MQRLVSLLLALLVVGVYFTPMNEASEPKTDGAIVHNVYFTLKDKSDEKADALIASCKKYLKPQPGVIFFACGKVADFDRSVNDRDWEVGLHVIFADQEAHDRYQGDAEHKKFIEENKENWEKVRVFDTVGK